MATRSSRSPSGLIIKQSHKPVPLKEVSIEAEIKACLLGLKSVLKYTNSSHDPVEVMFRFPLEDSSAVVGLTAIIDGRRIKAEVQEKEEARASYDDAIASGQSAALAEEKTGDVFSVTLGNLPPHKDAEIHLQVVAELSIDAEENVRFSLPSVLKPRYTPEGSTDPLAGISGTPSQVSTAQIAGFNSFQLSVLEPDRIATITSPTHSLSCQDMADRSVVTLSDQTSADKDLVILIKHKEPHKPSAVVEEGNDKEAAFMSQKAVMVNFFPTFDQIESPQCEFIFLVDRSGSMSGEFIQSASETLILFMKSLPANCYFNIIGFGSSYEQLFPQVSVPYSQSTLDQAVSHLTGLDANLGGTELLRPLEHIFKKKPHPGLSRVLFVLTDGAVSNTNACIQKVKQNSGSTRCFTFGIGSGASTALVEGLARAGDGSAEFVKEGERLQPKVIRSLKRALQPAVTDVALTFEIDGTPEVLQCPQSLPPIFAGEKLVAYALVKTKEDKITGKAVLKGKLLHQRISDTVTFESCSQCSLLSTVHHLAAKALIKDWEREGNEKEEIVKLSVESSVVSSHTAFIAVDEENSQPIERALKTWDLQAYDVRWYRAGMLTGGGSRGRGRVKQTARMSTGGKAPRKKLATKKAAPAKKRATASRAFRNSATVRSGPPPPFVGRRRRSRSRSRDREWSPKRTRMDYSSDSDSDSDCMETSVLGLSSIIGAQQADGSWKLNAALSQFVGKSLQEVTTACPIECTGVIGSLWATLLMLELLHSKFADSQEEWELVGAKAESWTKKQRLPTGSTLSTMKEAAKRFLV